LPIILASELFAAAALEDLAAALTGNAAAAVLAAAETIAGVVVLDTQLCGFDNHHIHGSPVVWSSPKDGPLVYVWAERDYLKAFRYDSGTRRFSNTSPAYRSSMEDPDHGGVLTTKFMPGAVLSLSANGSTSGSGIVWASLPAASDALASLAPGVLRAFDADGYVYFQGTDNRLYKVSVTNPNGDNTWLGGYRTKSTPFVADGYVYFQGAGSGDEDNRLYKVSVTNPNGDNTWLGGYKTKSAPFVDSGYIYFQADDGVYDDAVWRAPVDGSAGSIVGCNSRTLSTPFATGGRVYYQATDNRLMAVAD
jgi:hypothetical protein